MSLFLQFLAVLTILLFFYFHVFRKGERHKEHLHFAGISRSPGRCSVTRSEWKKGLY